MLSAYKFRLYPEQKPSTISCKELYNSAYHERLEYYEKTGKSLTYAEQQNALPEMIIELRNNYPELFHTLTEL